MGSLYDDASQAHSLESRNQERCSTCQTIHQRGQDCPDCKIPAVGQVWLTKSGNYAYIVQMNVFDVLNRDHRLGFLWYDKLDRELVCTEIMSQLDTPTDLTFTDWLSATGLGNNSQTPKIPANQETNLQIGDWVRIKVDNSVEVGMITEIDGEYALVINLDSEYKIRLTDCQLVYRRQDRLPLTWE